MTNTGKILPFHRDGAFLTRRGDRFMAEGKFIEALDSYRQALLQEPKNAEYALNVSHIYTEMGYYTLSNEVLWTLLQTEEESQPECLFGLGCNYLGMQDYTNASILFQRYLAIDEEGEFSEDAYDFLDMIDNYDDDEEYDEDLSLPELYDVAQKDANDGKQLLDDGKFAEAEVLLRRAVNANADLYYARNNLALSLFFQNKFDEAITHTKAVLARFPDSIHALCNMLLFYRHGAGNVAIEKDEYVEALLAKKPTETEELYKIGITFSELGMHKNAQQYFGLLLQKSPYDAQLLHYVAASCYNNGDYREAIVHWQNIGRILPDNTISDYYVELALQAQKGNTPGIAVHYGFQVPHEEIVNRIRKINYLANHEDELKDEWYTNPQLPALFAWGLQLHDRTIKRALLILLNALPGEDAQRLLQNFLLDHAQPDRIKQDIYPILKALGVPEPYIAYVDGHLVEVVLSTATEELANLTEEEQEVYHYVVSVLQGRFDYDFTFDLLDLWSSILKETKSVVTKNSVRFYAAALDYVFCQRESDQPPTQQEVSYLYKVSVHSLGRYAKKLREGWVET